MTSSQQQQQQQQQQPIEDLDWEEWDSSNGLSFTHHCLAGSFAGVAEHTLLYPLDTVKTCWQSQVLHRVANSGGNGSIAGCEPCSVHQTVNKFTPSAAATGAAAVNNNNTKQQQQQQSIWSTMKHLMRHGSHHNHQGGGGIQLFSHAHVTTLANSTNTTLEGLAPNVVDLTNNNNNNNVGSSRAVPNNGLTNVSNIVNANNTTTSVNNASLRMGGKKKKQQRRPWSKSARMVRGATLHDIAPSLQPSLYNTNSGASAASSSNSSATAAASLSSMDNALGNNTHVLELNKASHNNNTGFKRLWRGVQTMFVGCIPAHALYFSSYEIVKSVCLDHNQTNHRTMTNNDQHHVGIDTLSPTQAMFAGGIATLLHDFIMTPMDTMKQRMQLGHYYNLRDAFCSIVWGGDGVVATSGGSGSGSGGGGNGARMSGGEGWRGLYRSFPITVMTNVPYGMIMMTTNEWLRGESALHYNNQLLAEESGY